MMHVLTFRLHQLLENMLSPGQLLLGRPICRSGTSELLLEVVTVSRSMQLTTQAENVQYTVDGFGDLISLSKDHET
jgi:hypothetical protein